MELVTYPLNNVEYTAEDAELYNSTRVSGVFSNEDFDMSVQGTTAIVNEGLAWIQNKRFAGKVIANKNSVSLELGEANSVYDRWDVVAIRFDENLNKTQFVVIEGVAENYPSVPVRETSESTYELFLYLIYRKASELSVSQQNVTDVRLDRRYCGIMSDAVTTLFDHITLEEKEEKPEGCDIWKLGDTLNIESNAITLGGDVAVIGAKSEEIVFQKPLGIYPVDGKVMDCGYGKVEKVGSPLSDFDAANKKYVDNAVGSVGSYTDTIHLSEGVVVGTYTFLKLGKVVYYKLECYVDGSNSAPYGYNSHTIPDEFSPIPQCVNENAPCSVLMKKTMYNAEIVGSVALTNEYLITINYDFSDAVEGDTICATAVWVCK